MRFWALSEYKKNAVLQNFLFWRKFLGEKTRKNEFIEHKKILLEN